MPELNGALGLRDELGLNGARELRDALWLNGALELHDELGLSDAQVWYGEPVLCGARGPYDGPQGLHDGRESRDELEPHGVQWLRDERSQYGALETLCAWLRGELHDE